VPTPEPPAAPAVPVGPAADAAGPAASAGGPVTPAPPLGAPPGEPVESRAAEKRDPGPSQKEEPPGGTGGDTIPETMAATPDQDECPDPEEIAAFLDGTLPPARRARLTEHLASCERCYEVFAGAADFLAEDTESRDEETSPAAPALPFEPRRRRGALGPRAWWAAAAAVAALVAVGAGLLLRARGEEGLSTERYARYLAGSTLAAESFPWGRTLRGGAGENPDVPFDRTSFKLGVRLLDFRLALAGGDAERARKALSRLDRLLDDVDFLSPESRNETRSAYREIGRRRDAGAPPATLLPGAAKEEEQVFKNAVIDPPYVDLGIWTEACRLAGQAGRPELFRDRATRRLLDKAVEPGPEDAAHLLDPSAAASLRAIQVQVAAGRVDPPELGSRCRGLLEQLDPD
jgi:hypothetical protein